MNFHSRCGHRSHARLFASDASRLKKPEISDPTGTMPLQRQFTRAMDARWAQLRKMIPTAVALRSDQPNIISHAAATGQDAVRAFQAWMDAALLATVVGDGSWMLGYVRQAGDQAVLRAKASPTIDRIPALQTLAHTELQGIAEAVSQQAVRAYANGMLSNATPPAIARAVQQIIDTVGRARSGMLVSFIVVRAFSAATLDAYRAAGVSSVGTMPERIVGMPSSPVRDAKASAKKQSPDETSSGGSDLVEVLTAGDDNVCQECQDISDEGPYSLDEAENLIPAHPNCRCAFVPWDDQRYADVRESDLGDAGNDDEPRDASGKWTTSGDNVVAWHGTTTDRIDSILKNGLTTKTANADKRGNVVFVTHSKEEAIRHASERLGLDESDEQPVAIELHIPKTSFKSFKEDALQEGATHTDKNIPKSWIKSVHLGTIDAFNPDQPRDNSGKWSVGETDAVLDYVIGDQKKLSVNKKLRSGAALSVDEQKYADNLDSAIQKNKTKSDMVLYRGANNALGGVDKGFISLSRDPDVAKSFGKHLLEVHVPSGTPHLDVSKHVKSLDPETAGAVEEEQEIVLGRGHRLDVAGNGKSVSGKLTKKVVVRDAFNPDQPRDNSGKWSSQGGGSEQGLADLKTYLTTVAGFRGDRPSVEKFVLDHGKSYAFDKSSFEGKRDQIKMCYMNAGRIAMNSPDTGPSARTYVEGFITYHGVPIQHAWTVDEKGKVHDTTLRADSLKELGTYYGVPFKKDYVIQTAMKTKVWGILSHTNPSLWKEKDPKRVLADAQLALDFDPNQERDDQGRWTATGGSSSNNHFSDTPAQDLLALHHTGEETMADVERQLTPAQHAAATAAEASMAGKTPTNKQFTNPDGTYTAERAALHADILNKMFSPENIAHAMMPVNGARPVLTVTGGRPAAGKTSTLRDELAATDKNSFYISADTIQESLPGYKGAQAGLFNGEAQDIALQAEKIARQNRLNITYDATLKSTQPAIERVQLYKGEGYDVNGYFVHTAPVTSAVRSAQRFMASGRYVPTSVAFNSRTNEKTFDALIPMLDKWAIYDNNGDKPKMIARGAKKKVAGQ